MKESALHPKHVTSARKAGLGTFAGPGGTMNPVLGGESDAPADEGAIHRFLKSALAQAILIGDWSTGRIHYATNAAADLLGVRPDLLKGMSALQFFAHPRQRLDAMRRLKCGERAVRAELRLRSFDNRDLTVLADLGRIHYRGEPSLILVLNDVTHYKRQEYRLAEAEDRLRSVALEQARENDDWRERLEATAAASRAKSEFLARMSHELRSPLNAILGFAEVIRDGTLGEAGRARHGEYAGLIHQAGSHLLGIINDVLDLSKVEAGRMEFDPEPLDLSELASECLALMRPSASRRQIALTLADPPPRAPRAIGDRMRCRQILINLLSNAIKFTPAGGDVGIEIGHSRDGRVWLCVADSGMGMDAAEIEVALRPFGQIRHGKGTESAGTGLGLPIVRSLIEAQQGELEIDSRPGEGTRITINLPAGD